MKVMDFMTPNVECICPDSTVWEAAQKMQSLDVRALPVEREGLIIGILTDRDIVLRSTTKGQDPKHVKVSEIMTRHVVSCFQDEDLEEAVRLMQEHKVRRVLVLDRDQRPVGILTFGDIAARTHSEHLTYLVAERLAEPAHPMR